MDMSDDSESFVASIACALKSSQIPGVLWGQHLLNVHGIPSIISSVDFVVPDEFLTAGIDAIGRIDTLRPCPHPETCPTSSQERHTPPPAHHFHIDQSEITVGIYLYSETLWFLPPLDSNLLCPDKLPPQFVLASDDSALPSWRPGHGSGVFKSSKEPVVVPKAHVLLEAFLRIYARDSSTRVGAFAMPMIGYVEQYIDDNGLLDVEELPEPLKSSYKDLRQGVKPVRQWTKELKQALELPEEESESDEDSDEESDS
ncbi:hypothetical protein GCG54_00007762 [Colletotrichum gloeosporioides]|uniref:Thioredoxin reductase n=1 Tax=Colletotrichum gloeosporioides TaxID=474922 RepID=A0A8H4FGP0_COLGL|nr:uncharacterized protein GCG54_00007762 [Colletotrichum gloeosporioides]KAF3800314.1 hypothetical protein GCG54_00007762 [Colletotrichum gloeosporioides]